MSNEEWILMRLDQYSPKKIPKGSVGQQYPYSTRSERTIMSILHIYGALDIILLFCDKQDTETQ